MKKLFFTSTFLLFLMNCFFCFAEETVFYYDTSIYGDLPSELELPLCGDEEGKFHQQRDFYGYSICYREEYEQAEWAAYTLTKEKLSGTESRGNNFRSDPEIVTGSAAPEDYRGSGFDRGHLAPAADMAYDARAMSESFFLSNMSPQNPSFNRGIWKKCEDAARKLAEEADIAYVVTGPVLEKPAEDYNSIGINHVTVPEFYYKIILLFFEEESTEEKKVYRAETYSVIVPNEKRNEPCEFFLSTIDQIETRTNIDFFPALNDIFENLIEES